MIDRIPSRLAALIAFAVALSSPAHATGGCGGHVTYAGDRERPACVPCQGANCSAAPDAPPPAPAPRPAPDAVLVAPFAAAPEPGTWFGLAHLQSHPVHRVRPPDPPPRGRIVSEL